MASCRPTLLVVALAALLGCGGGGGSGDRGPPSDSGSPPPADGGAPDDGAAPGDGTSPGDGAGPGDEPVPLPPFDAAGFLAELAARPVPFDAAVPEPVRSTCRSRGVNGPGTESFRGPVPCLAGFCLENAPGTAFLWSFAGVPGGPLWVVGDGALLRFDGARWDTACAPLDGWLLRAAHAASASDAWIGGLGSLARLTNGAFAATPVDPSWHVFQLWGDSREAFATYSGTPPGILRWDGAAWSASLDTPYLSVLDLSVWGDGEGRAWATEGGLLAAWDGSGWTREDRPFVLRGVWAPAGGAPWFAGYTFRNPEWWIHDAAVSTDEGGTYVVRPLPAGLGEATWVRGSAADDVWIGATDGTEGGQVLRWNGTAWTSVPPPGDTGSRTPLVLAPDDAWVTGHGWDPGLGRFVSRVLHFDGAGWARSLELTAPAVAAVVTTPGELWTVAGSGLWRYDGSRWARIHDGGLEYGPRLATDGRSVWAAAHDAAGGGANVVRWDGAGVTTSRLPREPTAAFAEAGHAWIATAGSMQDGANAVVHHWDGSGWTPLDLGVPMRVLALWASGPRDLWAVGAIYPATWTSQTGVIAHWDGTSWVRRELGDYELRAVWGSGPRDVWVSGDTAYCQKCPAVEPAPLLLRWDGARLTKAAGAVLDALAGRSATEVWGLAWLPRPGSGDRLAVLHRFDGARWRAVARLEAPFRPHGLHVGPDGTLWGVDGGLLRREPTP